MLHAVISNKATPADVTGEGRKTPMEDLITSAVFGPLTYLGGAARNFLNEMMEKAGFGQGNDFFQRDEGIEISFWPKLRPENSERTYVEPDIVVIGKATDAEDEPHLRVLIIEVKWNAPLEPNQLKEQWEARCTCTALTNLAHASEVKFRHLLLVRNRRSGDLQQLDEHARAADAKLLTWHDISELAKRASETENPSTDEARCWARDVAAFLNRLGVRTQIGWEEVALEDVDCLPAFFTHLPHSMQVGWTDLSAMHVSSEGTACIGERNG